MTRRLALTPVIGLATASAVSFGAVSMWLTGVHGSPTQATNTNACSASSVKKADVRTAAHATAAHATAAHTAAKLPVLLDAAARTIHAGGSAKHTDGASAAASSSSPPNPSTGTGPSSAATPPVPDPTPGGGNVAPSTSPATPNPGSTGNVSASHHANPTVAPGGTNKTPKTTPTPTSTPTPTPSSTTTPPPTATLCLTVQTLGGSNTVQPGTTVHYAIWVWLSSGTGTAKVSVAASPSSVKPSFTVCQPTGKTTCKVSGLTVGAPAEAQVKLRAAKDLAGRDIKLNVTATSDQATNTATASDKIEVASKKKHSSPTPTPTPTNAGTGDGYTPPAGDGGAYPGVSNPNPTGNLGSEFPQVSPSPNAAPSAPGHKDQHQVSVTDLSAGLPLDVRLIGGQVVGLAILAAAVTIAIARLSLRKQPARHGDDNTGSTPTT
jgi:hypothetical protein